MTNRINISNCEIGMVGLGVMGRNLLLNMADHGFSVAGYDNDAKQVEQLRQESEQRHVHATIEIKEFIQVLRRPRAIILLVPAGAPVDAVIKTLLPHLEPGDLLIDAGNSYFKDTDTRADYLTTQGIHFLGVGVSGGEEGARHGPSIMPGGPKESYQRVQPIFEAVAAKVNGEPCVTYIGPRSAGHFVKMVHNGIEYGVMQLIAETYDIMKRGLGLANDQLAQVYSDWNKNECSSYLLEITSAIFRKKDSETGKPLIDEILAVAKQKGTGMWTSQSGMELQVPIPTIDIAVSMRDLSVFIKERQHANQLYSRPTLHRGIDSDPLLKQLQQAFFAGMVIVYAQGMALLSVASSKYQYQLNLEAVSRIWRGGCIIRAAVLDDIRAAFRQKPDLANLLLDVNLSEKLQSHEKDLRQIVCQAVKLELPIPGLAASLNYFDAYRSAWLPANLIQAQRDYFGAHTYERIDKPGTFHTEWEKK